MFPFGAIDSTASFKEGNEYKIFSIYTPIISKFSYNHEECVLSTRKVSDYLYTATKVCHTDHKKL